MKPSSSQSDLRFTKDAFHRGAFHLIQPAGGTHRAGIDAMLLAACAASDTAVSVADFGAGAGAAGLAVATRLEDATVTLVERDPVMLECASRTLALAENAAISNRASIVDADIETIKTGKASSALPADHFDWVIMNPPFNEPGDRASPHTAKADAHVMDTALFETWLKKAASVLHAKGQIALIARPSSLTAILNACERRFGGLRVVPVHPRAELDAIRILVIGQKGNRKRLTIAKGIQLQADADSHDFTSRAEALINGQATI